MPNYDSYVEGDPEPQNTECRVQSRQENSSSTDASWSKNIFNMVRIFTIKLLTSRRPSIESGTKDCGTCGKIQHWRGHRLNHPIAGAQYSVITRWANGFSMTVGVRHSQSLFPVMSNGEKKSCETHNERHTSTSTGEKPLSNLRFADDIDLMARNNSELQGLTNKLEASTSAYGMGSSSDKS